MPALLVLATILGGCGYLLSDDDPRPFQDLPSTCWQAETAIRDGDTAILDLLGIPATVDPDLVTGRVSGRHCTSSQPEGTFTLTILRDSGDVLVLRNTSEPPPPGNSAEQNAAIEKIGNDLGTFVVDGGAAVRLETMTPEDGGVPINVIFD